MSHVLLFLFAALGSTALAAEGRMRMDCRYHNVEAHPGVKFCYANAAYRLQGRTPQQIRFSVGCDYQTIYNDAGVHSPIDTQGDRISPPEAERPALELLSEKAIETEGSHRSVLDTSFGRMEGVCFVRKIEHEDEE